MTTYNFDQVIPRRGHGSIKWQIYAEDVLPMWVADMDFQSPQPVIDAVLERAAHGIYGYDWPSKELTELVCARVQRLYGWTIAPEAVVFLPTLVAGLNVAARAFAGSGGAVITHTPVYYPFLSAPTNFGATLQSVPLALDTTGPTLRYAVDPAAFAQAMTPATKLWLLCNPHNPGGFNYTPAELRALADACLKNNVIMCADEIHCELQLDGQPHTPLAALAPEIADRTITLMSPSKTFNVAGLCCSFAILPNETLRKQFKAAADGIVPIINTFGLTAAQAAWTHGDEWLAQLLPYLRANRDFLVDYVRDHLAPLRVTAPSATYLAWLDARALQEKGIDNPHQFFLDHARVGLNDGKPFGPGGEGFVRLNFGCPRATLAEGLRRLKVALESVK